MKSKGMFRQRHTTHMYSCRSEIWGLPITRSLRSGCFKEATKKLRLGLNLVAWPSGILHQQGVITWDGKVSPQYFSNLRPFHLGVANRYQID